MESEIFHAIENRDLAQVRRLLSSGEASLRDRDPGGSTVLHHAAQYCFLSEDSLAIFEFLVTNGADINATDFCGWPAHSFLSRYRIFTDHVGDIPIQQRFTKAYRICMRHPEWVMTRPSAEWNPVSKVDTICLANLSSAEAMSLALNEMWPPWEERTFSDRVDIIFPPHRDISPFAFPSSIRLCLGHNSFQDLFSECDVLRQRRLARYAFDALAVRLAERSTVMVEDARQLLKDMTSTTALLPLLAFESSPLHNFAKGYVWWYSNCSFSFGSSSTRWPLRDDECIIKEALTTYITEMMSLGMDIISLVEVENRYWQNQRLTLRESRSHNIKICRNEERSFLRCTYRSYCIIRLDCGPDIDKWRLWLSNPLDEWAGEFWDMIDHPERAIPGAWNDE
jgi:hypothetical protein